MSNKSPILWPRVPPPQPIGGSGSRDRGSRSRGALPQKSRLPQSRRTASKVLRPVLVGDVVGSPARSEQSALSKSPPLARSRGPEDEPDQGGKRENEKRDVQQRQAKIFVHAAIVPGAGRRLRPWAMGSSAFNEPRTASKRSSSAWEHLDSGIRPLMWLRRTGNVLLPVRHQVRTHRDFPITALRWSASSPERVRA
jgi:hypothetical protein